MLSGPRPSTSGPGPICCSDALDQLRDRERPVERADEAERVRPVHAERLPLGHAQAVADDRVVPDLRVRVQRQVVPGQRDVVVEQRLQPVAVLLAQRRPRPGAEEQAVVDDQHVGPVLRGALEQLQRRADAGRDAAHLGRSRHLHPDRHPIGVGADVQQLVQEAHDLVAFGHRPTSIPAAGAAAAAALDQRSSDSASATPAA